MCEMVLEIIDTSNLLVENLYISAESVDSVENLYISRKVKWRCWSSVPQLKFPGDLKLKSMMHY